MNIGDFESVVNRIRNGETKSVLDMVDFYPDLLTYHGSHGHTLLHHACITRNFNLVFGLIKNNTNINAKDLSELEPIVLAANYGAFEIVVLLIDNGSNPNSRNNGMSALSVACQLDHIDIALYLITKGANLMEIIYNNKTALDFIGWCKTLTNKEKEERCNMLHYAYNKRIKDENWKRRMPFMIVMVENKFLPLIINNLALKLSTTFLTNNQKIPTIILDTPEKKKLYIISKVFCNIDLVRIIGKFI
jgi:hypothetical protein